MTTPRRTHPDASCPSEAWKLKSGTSERVIPPMRLRTARRSARGRLDRYLLAALTDLWA